MGPPVAGRIEEVQIAGSTHAARVVSFVDGPLLASRDDANGGTWRTLGDLLGRVAKGLEGFDHPQGAKRFNGKTVVGRLSYTVGGGTPTFTIDAWANTQFRVDAERLDADIEALRVAGLPIS